MHKYKQTIFTHGNSPEIFAPNNPPPNLAQAKAPPSIDYQRKEYEEKVQANNERQWMNAGFNRDGSKTPIMKLRQNKYWQNFDERLATPMLEGYSLITGVGEFAGALRAITLRNEIINILAKSVSSVKTLDAEAIVGLRGSVVTGTKFKSGAPFNLADFDVDAFIVSDNLALKYKPGVQFRDGNRVKELKGISNELESIFSQYGGYRTDAKKPFTFRIFTTAEFQKIMAKGAVIIL